MSDIDELKPEVQELTRIFQFLNRESFEIKFKFYKLKH